MGILSTFKKKDRLKTPFEEAYQAFYKPIVQKLTYMIGDVHVAEELAQEVFLKLYQTPPSHNDIEPWLRVVAARRAYNYLRDLKTHMEKENALAQWNEKVDRSAEDVYLSQREQQLTAYALEQLHVRERTCLILKHSGYKYAEIAEIIEVDTQAVGVLISRAQAKFKKIYEQMEEGGGQP